MMRLLLLVPLIATAALAQLPDQLPPRITVTVSATVNTPPDRATIRYTVHGEGATSDAAVSALVGRQREIAGGLGRYAAGAAVTAQQVAIAEVRGRDCRRNDYGNPQLSTGECAIVGYTADVQTTATIAAVADAGTIVGLLGRLGATNPRVERFFLADDRPARARAAVAAVADAKARAQAIATGAGVTLGPILSASDATYQPGGEDIVVTGTRMAAAPPPPPPPPPIAVALTPRPIETEARVTVSYAIGR